MPYIKKPLINYTNREFETIKADLVNYAQKYYPETMQDFNEASFGSLMLDMVALVGDMLSFYIDYQANESFIETASEFENVLNLSKHFGYKYKPNASSFGEASFFILVPGQAGTVSPNMNFAPILRKGSLFSTTGGTMFTLMEDVDFGASTDIVVGAANSQTGAPTSYAIKAKGIVISGELLSQDFPIQAYQKFLRLELRDNNVTEVVAVFDANGNNYYEVDYLTQDTAYVSIINNQANQDTVRNILKPVSVPRRFVVEHTATSTALQFGFGTTDNESKILDPTNVILNVFGKDHFTETSFDPSILIKTDKLGVVPSDTVLTVIYRRNTTSDVNAATNALRNRVSPQFRFRNSESLDAPTMVSVRNSLELTNENPIFGDVSDIGATELKYRAYGAYGAQNRAVTRDDYVSLVYNMPSNFGQVKKANIERDIDSFSGKNLNLHVISTDTAGNFAPTNLTIKQNLKTWINQYKMLGDTIDILDARVINLDIKFTVVAFANVNKYDVLQLCLNTLTSFFKDTYYDIGEPFKITDVYKLLNNISQVLDVKDVTVTPKGGATYSAYSPSFDELISDDGRYLIIPNDTVFEIKDIVNDIDGEVI